MELPGTLLNKIIDFLKSLPNFDDSKGRRAFIYSTKLDSQLQKQIPFDEPPAQFTPYLVSLLCAYGELNDGRNALEAVLEEAKNYVGQNKKKRCDTMIKELRTNTQERSQPLKSNAKRFESKTTKASTPSDASKQSPKNKIHFHEDVKGVVIGDNSTVTMNFGTNSSKE